MRRREHGKRGGATLLFAANFATLQIQADLQTPCCRKAQATHHKVAGGGIERRRAVERPVQRQGGAQQVW